MWLKVVSERFHTKHTIIDTQDRSSLARDTTRGIPRVQFRFQNLSLVRPRDMPVFENVDR